MPATPTTTTWRTSSHSGEGPSCVEVAWRTSTHSGNGASCVEVGWHTSTHSANGQSCVEVTPTNEQVLTRDSKNPTGPALSFSTTEWRRFLHTLDR
ncbi:DUF397 domain-containing protein [Saccharothrix violaceirubra]|uniref:DUF397 domain-containing protein n=1 Tax=Saccharothrix violaceirubra TaxID=413306 RepID=A0A7W7WUC2_9PSEU|nr:DUF397 domain-containing protein [Saccharothrix violaceirubra]MBB4963602.1 hypothetical protein [Saccharothrix violaceirubra]